jgi:hypothetical protein
MDVAGVIEGNRQRRQPAQKLYIADHPLAIPRAPIASKSRKPSPEIVCELALAVLSFAKPQVFDLEAICPCFGMAGFGPGARI